MDMQETNSSESSLASQESSNDFDGRLLSQLVLEPMKQVFVGKDEIIDLMGIALVARENLFLLGPPGTAKSALVQELARRLEGKVFDYLLTRFTEPNEIFGPFDIRKLRDGELATNTEGMLPEATFVFLDELLNANSAILNSLLLVLNERVFRRGRETWQLPTLMVVGASNHLPQDEALGALFDRFLIRVRCDNVPHDRLSMVLTAGRQLAIDQKAELPAIELEKIRALQQKVDLADFSQVQDAYVELILGLRKAGIQVSDRRAVKIQRLLAASALLCGRLQVEKSDMWIVKYIWDTDEQREVLGSLVDDALGDPSNLQGDQVHPRARDQDQPDAELLARDLDELLRRLNQGTSTTLQELQTRDQLSLLASRIPWIEDVSQREFLEGRAKLVWQRLKEGPITSTSSDSNA